MPNFMTQSGFDKIREQLDFLVKVKRKEINEAIETARAFGDLKENAEYHAAKENQAMNERKISELSTQIADAQIIDDSQLPSDRVAIGSNVRLWDYKYEEEITYTLVSEMEADPVNDRISVTSPVGKGLMGKKKDEEVVIEVPAGEQKYKVLEITRD